MATDRRIIRGTTTALFAAIDAGKILEGNMLHDETTGITYYSEGEPNTPTTRELLRVIHDPTLVAAYPLKVIGRNAQGVEFAWEENDQRVQRTTTTINGVTYPTVTVTTED